MSGKPTRLIPGAVYRTTRSGREYFTVCQSIKRDSGRVTGLFTFIGFADEWIIEGTEDADVLELVGVPAWAKMFEPVAVPREQRQEPGNEDAKLNPVPVPADKKRG